MKNITGILFLLIIFLLFIGCEDKFSNVIELDIPDHDPALVAYSFIDKNASKIIMDMSQSKGILEKDNDFHVDISGVKILKNGVPFIDDFEGNLIFSHIDYDNYPQMDSVFKFVIQADSPGFDDVNATYSLEVTANGFETITADVTIPKTVEVNDATYTKDGFVDSGGWHSDEVEVKFHDPGDVDNYYMVVLLNLIQTEDFVDTSEMWSTSNEPGVKDSWYPIIPGVGDFIYFSDKNFNGHDHVLKLGTGVNSEGADILVRLYSISKDLYNFIKSYNLYQRTNGSPFSEPVIVNNNIVNGYGLFTIYDYEDFVIELE